MIRHDGGQPEAVVFDLDGTLVDTEDVILQGTRYALDLHVERSFTDDELWELYGRPVDEVWRVLGGERAAALNASYLEFYHRNRLELVRAFPGVLDTIAHLARRGVRLGLLSTKTRPEGLTELTSAGLDGVFEVMAFVEDQPSPKPDAGGLLAILDQLGVRPSQALMVGDGPMDILCGRDAGARTGVALWARQAKRQRAALEQLQPTHVFTRLPDLLELFPRGLSAETSIVSF